MSSMFPLHAKSESESDLSRARLDAEGLPVQYENSRASVGSSDFMAGLEVRIELPPNV